MTISDLDIDPSVVRMPLKVWQFTFTSSQRRTAWFLFSLTPTQADCAVRAPSPWVPEETAIMSTCSRCGCRVDAPMTCELTTLNKPIRRSYIKLMSLLHWEIFKVGHKQRLAVMSSWSLQCHEQLRPVVSWATKACSVMSSWSLQCHEQLKPAVSLSGAVLTEPDQTCNWERQKV